MLVVVKRAEHEEGEKRGMLYPLEDLEIGGKMVYNRVWLGRLRCWLLNGRSRSDRRSSVKAWRALESVQTESLFAHEASEPNAHPPHLAPACQGLFLGPP